MQNEFPENDPQKIWQNQPTEVFKMSAAEMRVKAQKLHTRARFNALTRITIGLSLFVCFGSGLAKTHDVLTRLGWGVLSIWAIYSAYDAYKRVWPRPLQADAPVGTSLEFYRSELERQRDYVRHIWRRTGLTYCFLGLAIIVVPALINSLKTPALLLNAVPFFVLLLIWFPAFLLQKGRTKSKLQKEIDQLRAFERENQA